MPSGGFARRDGGGGGGGLHFRDPPDRFTGADLAACRTARDTYFRASANADALPQFVADRSLAIILDPADSTNNTFQTYLGSDTYDADEWLDRTDAVEGNQGIQGAQGLFEIHIYRNTSGPIVRPVGGSYNIATDTLVTPAGWADDPETPGSNENSYTSTAHINPLLQSGVVVPVWSVPAERPKGVKGDVGPPGLDSADLTRAESVLFNALVNINEDAWKTLIPKAGDTTIGFGSGDPEIIDDTTNADATSQQIRVFPGLYMVVFQGTMETDQERAAPTMRIREKTRNTLLGLSPISYLREDNTSDTVILVAPTIIPVASTGSPLNADGTRSIEFNFRSSPTSEVGNLQNGQFDILNNSRISFYRWGGGDSEAVTSSQIDARIRALVNSTALIGNTDRWTVAKVDSLLATDAEVAHTIDSSVATEARTGNTSPWPDSKIPADIVRNTALQAAIRDFQTLTQVNARINAIVRAWARSDALIPDNQIPASITRDTQLAAAIADFLTQSQVDARADARIAASELVSMDDGSPDWAASKAYNSREICKHDGHGSWATYISLQAVHANTAATTEPGAGSDWRNYWDRLGFEDGPPNAFISASISENTITFGRESGNNPVEIDISAEAVPGSSRGNKVYTSSALPTASTAITADLAGITWSRDSEHTEYTSNGTSIVLPKKPPGTTREVIGLWFVTEEFNAAGTVEELGQALVAWGATDFSTELLAINDTHSIRLNAEVSSNEVRYNLRGAGVAVPANRRVVVYEAVSGREGPAGRNGGFTPVDLGETTFNLTGVATEVALEDDGDAIVCPANGMIIAVTDIPSLGFIGATEWMLATDLREAVVDATLTAGLYTNDDNEIFLHVGAQSGASTGNKILIRHIGTTTDSTGGAAGEVLPIIRNFTVTGEQRPAAGSIAGDRYDYTLNIGRSAHAASARIVGFAGTAANPASVAVLRTVRTLEGETSAVIIPAGVSLLAGGKYTIRAEVYKSGTSPASSAPTDYHDYVITARQAATALTHFGVIGISEDETDIVFADDDIRSASDVAGSWSVSGIQASDGNQRMYWAVPASESQPATWTSSGFNVANSIEAAVDRTIGGTAYKVYLSKTDSPLDHTSNGYTIVIGV